VLYKTLKSGYFWDIKTDRWTLRDREFCRSLESMNKYQEEAGKYVISQCLNFGSAEKLVQAL